MISSVVFASLIWIDRIWFTSDPAIQQRIPFMIGFTIVFLGFVTWTLYHPAGRAYFNANYSMCDERKDNDGT
jgi:hypothetical protein